MVPECRHFGMRNMSHQRASTYPMHGRSSATDLLFRCGQRPCSVSHVSHSLGCLASSVSGRVSAQPATTTSAPTKILRLCALNVDPKYMSKTIWKNRLQEPSRLRWVLRIAALAVALFIWANSASTLLGTSTHWGGADPSAPWPTPARPRPALMQFAVGRFCLNLNGAPFSVLPQGMPRRYASYVDAFKHEGSWQLFQYGFVVPAWAISLAAVLPVWLAWRPRIFRPRSGYCSNCNYNLCGLKSTSACPECGAVASPGS